MNTIKFEEISLTPMLLKAISGKNYERVTPVQEQAIPALLKWKDVIAKAPTGTGKTFAFGIPVIEHIDTSNSEVQALILAPTRELVIQITSELKTLVRYMPDVRIASIYGGQNINIQLNSLKKMPQIIVATPGRLIDHINRRTISLRGVLTAVLDEADRMVDMGFYMDVTRILDLMPKRKNLALLSATLTNEVMTIGWIYQRDAVEITVPEDSDNKPDIVQYKLETTESQKMDNMLHLIKNKGYKKVMVFCNTKHSVKRLTKNLIIKGYSADCIHGDIRQSTREKVMALFRSGKLNMLIATDIASRGIDIDNVDTVINYDIPKEKDHYIHRIGRTGRAKNHGSAYTFVSSLADSLCLKDIEKYTRTSISAAHID